MAKRIDIVINPKTGEIEFEINGVPGSKCTDIKDILTRGHNVKEERLTQEFYAPENTPLYNEDL